jgi:mRNA-degrading endonuclease RelE of RelBE toxin-antitoxin system
VTYRAEITPAAYRDMKGIPKDAIRRIDAAILLLAQNPRPPKAQRLCFIVHLIGRLSHDLGESPSF